MQTNKKFKIAICISGELRYWAVTKQLYNHFHQYYSDEVDFDFFIVTWTPNEDRISISNSYNRNRPKAHQKPFHGNLITRDEVVQGLNRLQKFKMLDMNTELRITHNQDKFYYLIHRCNLLKSMYEVKNDFVYDCVLITRPDIIQTKDTPKALYNFCTNLNYTDPSPSELFIFSTTISTNETKLGGISTMDTAFYGRSATMDTFSTLFKYVFLSDKFNLIPMSHTIPLMWMKYAGLYVAPGRGVKTTVFNKNKGKLKWEKYKELISKGEIEKAFQGNIKVKKRR
jgi:hypothetical protein